MKRISAIIGLCLLAVVAVSAVAVATAAAEEPIPYLFKLITAGKESNIEGGKFTSKGGKAELRTASVKVVCASSTNKGEFEKGAKAAHLGIVTVEFEGCETTILGIKLKCQSGATEGKIVLENWIFHLGAAFDPELGKWGPAILILLKEGETNGTFKFKCGTATVTVTATGAVGGLFKAGTTEPAKTGVALSTANLNFKGKGEAGKEAIELLYTEFYFPLEKVKVGLLKLVSENSITKTKEESIQVSEDTLEKFTNSSGAASEVELIES